MLGRRNPASDRSTKGLLTTRCTPSRACSRSACTANAAISTRLGDSRTAPGSSTRQPSHGPGSRAAKRVRLNSQVAAKARWNRASPVNVASSKFAPAPNAESEKSPWAKAHREKSASVWNCAP
jgi:hypothetical protein